MERLGFALALAVLPLDLPAQTLSAADIKAQVDQKVAGLNEYQMLLNDPDPQRAMAAMRIMLDSKDPDLVRMALSYGIFSPNPAVRRTALEAFLASGPALRVTVDGSGANDPKDFAYFVKSLGGTIDEKGMAFLSLLVGAFDAEQNCYLLADTKGCVFRLSDAGQALMLWNTWWSLELGADGHLVGTGDMRKGNTGIGISIPVTR